MPYIDAVETKIRIVEALHTIGQIDIFENIRDSHTFLVLGMITAVRTVITD